MTGLLLTPVILSLLLLAAHASRAGLPLAVSAVIALLPLLLLVRRRWVAAGMQALLLLGAAEWVRTLVALVLVRRAMGLPALRMALILGAVALLTAASALVFRHGRLRSRFAPDDRVIRRG